MNKFLYYISILSSVVFGNIEVNANTPLQELMNDESKTAIFNGDTISCEGITIDPNDYIHNNNTFYINTDTIPLLSNTREGK